MKKNKKAKLPGASLQESLPSAAAPQDEDPVDNYKVRDHMDTLVKAHGIQQDPDKMALVHKLAGRHMDALKGLKVPNSAIKSTDDLRKLKNKKFSSPQADSDGE